ncbi:hypothetical protein AAFF_G00285500 [Aldrovandia affinis]|uniref:Uncharacterized protein n=1 Tax=Aldrovandia affinis TaxID=143900 RepID=A0AAD7TAT4_9TELE|nr:hypothetical protein AAFF_G00285500 [Aldrovandia affinis]
MACLQDSSFTFSRDLATPRRRTSSAQEQAICAAAIVRVDPQTWPGATGICKCCQHLSEALQSGLTLMPAGTLPPLRAGQGRLTSAAPRPQEGSARIRLDTVSQSLSGGSQLSRNRADKLHGSQN